MSFESTLKGMRVLVTGHTGFTGGWVSTWLRLMGAVPLGLSLPPETSPSLYTALGLQRQMDGVEGDIRDQSVVRAAFERFRPEAVLHLAAQPLVRRSYAQPVETFATNVMGTVHVLEAARASDAVKAVLCITTDKVYQNQGWVWPYRESDPLGGSDPYSASKSASEMVVESYRHSFTGPGKSDMAIGVARGGNIIGGGDWSEDRLVPDFVRAVRSGEPMTLRYPEATRPWQHVMALAEGYLTLLAALIETPQPAAKAWNFGPVDPVEYSVRDVVELLAHHWTRPDLRYMDSPLHEMTSLGLDSSRARLELGWKPKWDTPTAIMRTAEWYRAYYANPAEAHSITLGQIQDWRAPA